MPGMSDFSFQMFLLFQWHLLLFVFWTAIEFECKDWKICFVSLAAIDMDDLTCPFHMFFIGTPLGHVSKIEHLIVKNFSWISPLLLTSHKKKKVIFSENEIIHEIAFQPNNCHLGMSIYHWQFMEYCITY